MSRLQRRTSVLLFPAFNAPQLFHLILLLLFITVGQINFARKSKRSVFIRYIFGFAYILRL